MFRFIGNICAKPSWFAYLNDKNRLMEKMAFPLLIFYVRICHKDLLYIKLTCC